MYGDGSVVFDIEQEDKISPLHDECGCIL